MVRSTPVTYFQIWYGNPPLPQTMCARTVRIILPAAHAVGNIPFANRALPCNVWECPHYPPAWQGDLPPAPKRRQATGARRQVVPSDRWCQATGPLLRSSAPPLLRSSAPPLLRASAPPLLRSSAPPLLRSSAPPLPRSSQFSSVHSGFFVATASADCQMS